MKDQRSVTTTLFDFFLLGCCWADLCRANMLFYDFHEGNIIFGKNKGFKVIDFDDVEEINFLDGMETYARGLSNLFNNFGMDYGAAFRYGFTTVAGEAGKVLFDILYNNNGITPLNDPVGRRQNEAVTESLPETYSKWNELVEESFVRKMTNGTYRIDEYSFIELMQRHDEEYHSFKATYKQNEQLIKHEYQVYLANGLVKENDFDIISSALTLCQIECKNKLIFLSAYYFFLLQERIVKNKELHETQKEKISYAFSLMLSSLGIDKFEQLTQLIEYVKHETFRLRLQHINTSGISNPYLEIWYWSDFSKAHSIDDFFDNRHYGCYRCCDCNHIDFFDKVKEEPIRCASCSSKNIELIPLQEYISLYASRLDNQDNQDSFAQDNTLSVHAAIKDTLPNLDRVAYIPIYIDGIKQLERNNRYDEAIDISKQVILYLHSNPSIIDENGYVVDTSRRGEGRILYSVLDPSNVVKLFHVDLPVRCDYESYFYCKLIDLNEKKGDRTTASEYAQKLIEIANCSPRWIRQQYIERAFELLHDYYVETGAKTEALTCSNALFTYHMIEAMGNKNSDNEDYDEVISQFLDVGISNANVGNISLAFSCYIFALSMHVYHHGFRHPDSAIIYHLLAQVAVRKKLYTDANKFWAVSLMLLEVRKEHFAELIKDIETCISDCLSETSNATLQEWKKEWMKERSFSVFPENRFKKPDPTETSLPRINISEEELLREYVALII